MKWFPRKRALLAFHRWLGAFSAVFLVVLSVTGLALNHTERLGLNDIQIRSSLILEQYGMAGRGEIETFRIDDTATVSHLDGQLFHGIVPLVYAGLPLGSAVGEGFIIIATERELVYITPSGDLIEKLDTTQLPYESLLYLGTSNLGEPVLVAANGVWQADADWVDFVPYEGAFEVSPLVSVELDNREESSILKQHQGGGVSLYRVLLDLHSGRIVGWGGRTIMDLTAVAILLLLSSGVVGWLRKSRWGYSPRR